jgi:MarR family transcriptional regulator, transcriptional regulator for hemolysin
MKHTELAFLLNDTGRLLRRRFDAKAAPTGIRRTQWQLLWTLSHTQGCCQAELADLLEIEAITLSRMIDRMEEARLVERRANPVDRRQWRLYLTPAAEPLMTVAETIGENVMDEALAGVPDGAAEALAGALLVIRGNLAGRIPEADAW